MTGATRHKTIPTLGSVGYYTATAPTLGSVGYYTAAIPTLGSVGYYTATAPTLGSVGYYKGNGWRSGMTERVTEFCCGGLEAYTSTCNLSLFQGFLLAPTYRGLSPRL